MASSQADAVKATLFAEEKDPDKPLELRRSEWIADAEANSKPPEGTKIEAAVLAGVPAEWITHPDALGVGVFLLLHGGGYNAGNCVTHRRLASLISAASGMRVLVPDYRLAPENPFPAAVQDALAVYGAVLADKIPAGQICVGGDSAGGGLAAALLLALRDAGAPLPASGVMLSPWTDILCEGESYAERKEIDPSIDPDGLRDAGRLYCGEGDPNHPLMSPVKADLAGLPPLLIQVGDCETMLDDSRVFAQRAEAAGVDVSLEVWPEMWHVWHQWAPDVPEAVEAIDKIGRFVRDHMRD